MHAEIDRFHESTRSLFDLLKLGTTDLQRKIEMVLPLTRNDLTFSKYREFLSRLLGFYIPVEEHISDFLSHQTDPFQMEKRSKVPLLISDLRALSAPMDEIHQIPICGAIKEISSMAELVGVLYATESLTLSSAHVLDHLRRYIQLNENQIKFFSGYKQETHRMWALLRATSEAYVNEQGKETAVTRARSTFIKFKNWMKMSEV